MLKLIAALAAIELVVSTTISVLGVQAFDGALLQKTVLPIHVGQWLIVLAAIYLVVEQSNRMKGSSKWKSPGVSGFLELIRCCPAYIKAVCVLTFFYGFFQSVRHGGINPVVLFSQALDGDQMTAFHASVIIVSAVGLPILLAEANKKTEEI